jgi:hypothetical protein
MMLNKELFLFKGKKLANDKHDKEDSLLAFEKY